MSVRHRPRSLSRGFEKLEGRSLLAGNVLADFHDGTLSIVGDRKDNQVEIRDLGGGSFQVTGLNGTRINGGPSRVITVPVGQLDDLKIDMGAGNDVVKLIGDTSGSRTSVNNDVQVDLGQGNDSLTLSNLATGGELSIEAGDGNDRLRLENASVTGNSNLDLGRGNNDLALSGVDSAAAVDIEGSSGRDVLKIDGMFRARTLSIDLAAGADRVDLGWVYANVDAIDVNMGAGQDEVDLSGYFSGYGYGTDTRIAVQTGQGNDKLSLQWATISGDLAFDMGAGNDSVSLYNSSVDALFAQLGAGKDCMRMDGGTYDVVDLRGDDGRDKLELLNVPTISGSYDADNFETLAGQYRDGDGDLQFA